MAISKLGFRPLLVAACCALSWSACGDAPAGADRAPSESALDEALRLGDPLLRAERIARQLQELDAAGARAALDAFERHAAHASAEDAAWFAIAAARVDPARTLERVLRWPDRSLRERAAAEAVSEWARRDPGAAAAELRSRPDLDLRPALVRGWAEADPDAALRFVAAQPAGRSRRQQVRALVAVLRRRAPEAGLHWLEALLARSDLPAPVRRELLAAGVSAAARSDPVGTAAWLGPRLDSAGATGAIAALADAWGELDPPGAAAWLDSLPASAERDRALHELFRAWSARDPQEAQRWRREAQRATGPRPLPGELSR